VKRSGLKRTKPLVAKTRLVAKKWMQRSKPVQRRPTDTGPTKDTRDLVKKRAKYGCERCGKRRGHVIHHRDPRGAGGSSRPEINDASNLVLLCIPCHADVETNRLQAIGDGFLIPDGQEMHPLTTKVRLWHGTYYLKDDGSLEEAS
jgi:hypothetical protein